MSENEQLIGLELTAAVLRLVERGIFDEVVQGRIKRSNEFSRAESQELYWLREASQRWERGCFNCGSLRAGSLDLRFGRESRKTPNICDDCFYWLLDLAFKYLREHACPRWPGADRLGRLPRDLSIVSDPETEEERLVPEPRRSRADLYFARSLLGGDLIKIGISRDVERRMKDIHAEAILVLRDRGEEEGELHARFDHLRVHGEWFRPKKELVEFIEVLRQP